MSGILGGKKGALRCCRLACNEMRYPGRPECPRHSWGDFFDPILHAQAVARAQAVHAGEADPVVGRLRVHHALGYARWLVERGSVGWPLALVKASKKHGVALADLRRLAAQRSANSRATAGR